ncbi:MAG: DUF6882 domain-containing protein [Pseudomonadota bacterium]
MACKGGHSEADGFRGEGYFPRCPECGGYHRDLTPAFQGLVMEACAAVIPTSRQMHREFLIDAPETSWRYDTQMGLCTLSTPGRGRSHAEFQSVGTWIEHTGNFKWAWAWDDAERAENAKAADHARRIGAHYWLRSLTAPTIYVGETEAWHLAMVTAYLSDLPAVSAAPTENGKTFIVLQRPIREN